MGGRCRKMSSYLVTGGAGFIGSHLAEELLRRGHCLRIADNFITGRRQNRSHLHGVEILEGDLADVTFAERTTQGMDYVLHQAAIRPSRAVSTIRGRRTDPTSTRRSASCWQHVRPA